MKKSKAATSLLLPSFATDPSDNEPSQNKLQELVEEKKTIIQSNKREIYDLEKRHKLELEYLKEEIKEKEKEKELEINEITKNNKDRILEIEKQLENIQINYKKEFLLRRKYYNELVEIKGNIRVFCRVRPLLPFELSKSNGSINTCNYISEYELKITVNVINNIRKTIKSILMNLNMFLLQNRLKRKFIPRLAPSSPL